MDGKQGRRFGGRVAARVAALALLLAALLWPTPSAPALAAGTARISGVVGGVPLAELAGAQVVVAGDRPVAPVSVTPNGAYALNNLSEGSYELSVRPRPSDPTISPTWVYTAGAVLVRVPPDITQNLLVVPASVTLTGLLIAPQGSDFSGANAAYVRAENQEGQGNSVQVRADGSFSVHTLPGPIILRMWFANQRWSAPSTLRGAIYDGQSGETIDTGTFVVQLKQASISGKVAVGAGGAAAPAGIPVRAWRADGTEFADTLTGPGGVYSLSVISGTWLLRATPLPDKTYGTLTDYYVPAQPPQRITLPEATSTITRDLLIARADLAISGQTVDGTSTQVPLPPLTSGVDGRVYALYRDSTGHLSYGPSAPVSDGTFTLRLASTLAQSYTVGVFFPQDVPYTALARVPVSLTQGVPSQLTVPIAPDNSHIRGSLNNSAGVPVTGLPGLIWARSDTGAWARTRINPLDGSYDLQIATTNLHGHGGNSWQVRAVVDPTTGYVIQRPRNQRVFLPFADGAGSTVELDFTVVQPNAILRGRVTGPDGTPLPGARVVVREFTGEATDGFERWAYTNLQGEYRARVPTGVYQISAFRGLPLNRLPDLLIAPAPTLAQVDPNSTTTTDLRFRRSDTLVSGNITLNGMPQPALVRARSTDGASVNVASGPNGSFRLPLLQGQSWSIQAVSSTEGSFLRSQALQLMPAADVVRLGAPLALVPVEPLPDSAAFLFDGGAAQLLTLSNGAQIEVPSEAIGTTSQQVTLIAIPLPELAADGGARPLSFGYRLKAFVDNHPTSRFDRPITLIIPFTAEQLRGLGVSADRLVPSYYDEASSSWKPVEQVSITLDASGSGIVSITVDHFTDFALLAAPGGALYLPGVRRQ